MSTYTDTVIANGVDALWLCDTPDANHSTLVPNVLDVSGNARHALCFEPSTATNHVHEERDTPILTDPGSLIMAGRVGSWIDTVSRNNNFAWQGWMYNDLSSGPRAMLCRRGHFSSTGAAIVGLSSGGNRAIAHFKMQDGAFYTLYSDEALTVLNGWNYLVANYADNAIGLWINACLGAQVNNVTGDVDFSPLNFIGGGSFFIGAQHGRNTLIWYSRGLYGVGFGPALVEAQIVENFESAGYIRDCPSEATPGFRNYCLSIDEDTN